MITEVETNRPPKLAEVALRIVEGVAWIAGALVLAATIGVIVEGSRGHISMLASLAASHDLSTEVVRVDAGLMDVTLSGVPISASWTYLVALGLFAVVAATFGAVVALLARSVRCGRPFAVVKPCILYIYAGLWSGLAIATPFILAYAQPRMAESVGAVLPGATFAYTMTEIDLAAIFFGPILAIATAIFASGTKMWADHRKMV